MAEDFREFFVEEDVCYPLPSAITSIQG